MKALPALFLSAATALSTVAMAQDGIPTASVRRGDLVRTISTIGSLQAARSANVAAPYDAKVIRIVPEGTRVEANEPVIWLDTQSLQDQLKEEEAKLALALKDLEATREEYKLRELQNAYNLESEMANVELAQQRLNDAERNYKTEEILVERNISARSRLDEAQLSLNQAAVQLRGARIDLQKLQENLASNLRVQQTRIDKAQLEVDKIKDKVEELKEKIDTAILKAPVAGEVSHFLIWRSGNRAKIQEGDTVWRDLNILAIPDRSVMLAVVPVNELDIADVEAEQPVEVFLDALPGRPYAGIVERKSIVPIEGGGRNRDPNTTGPREFEVRIRMQEANDFFFQGMTAAARIEVGRVDGALLVPLEALTLNDDRLGVHARTSGSGNTFVPTEVLMTNNLHAAVEGDLREGDVVFLRAPNVSRDEARRLSSEALRRVSEQSRKASAAAANAGTAQAPRATPGGGV